MKRHSSFLLAVLGFVAILKGCSCDEAEPFRHVVSRGTIKGWVCAEGEGIRVPNVGM